MKKIDIIEDKDFVIIGPIDNYFEMRLKASMTIIITGLFFISFISSVFIWYLMLFTMFCISITALFFSRKTLSKIDKKGILTIQQYLWRKKCSHFIGWETINAIEIRHTASEGEQTSYPYLFFIVLDDATEINFKQVTEQQHHEKLLATIVKFIPYIPIQNDKYTPFDLAAILAPPE